MTPERSAGATSTTPPTAERGPVLEGGRASYITGDVRDALAGIPDGSVDLVLTSPPFLALRSYLPADHPDKHREIGGEPDPASFLATLLGLTAEFRRVLAPHGSICVELGDTYSGSGGAGGDYSDQGQRQGQGKFDGSARRTRQHNMAQGYSGGRHGNTTKEPGEIPYNGGPGWPLAKSLCGIPHLYHLSLAYGRNILTGEPCEPWRVRNVVAWCRPNPPVGALGDKFRPATSYMTIACVSGSRYFDLDAVRTEHKRPAEGNSLRHGVEAEDTSRNHLTPGRDAYYSGGNPGGAPPLDWWEIPTTPYAGAHYAAFPPALLERPIKSMVPAKVCTTCGEPSRRIVEPTAWDHKAHPLEAEGIHAGGLGTHGDRCANPTTIGFTDCSHGTWRPGIVLDPFAGSGTTLAVATGRGHHGIGIDLDSRNVALARDRVGPMFLDEFTLDEWKARP